MVGNLETDMYSAADQELGFLPLLQLQLTPDSSLHYVQATLYNSQHTPDSRQIFRLIILTNANKILDKSAPVGGCSNFFDIVSTLLQWQATVFVCLLALDSLLGLYL